MMADEAFDAAFDAAQQRNDAWRTASSADHSDEIEMLERALCGDLSGCTPRGVRVMRDRLLFLKASYGLLPLRAAAE